MEDRTNPGRLTAADVLNRYKHLPAFDGLELVDVNQASPTGERPLDIAAGRGDVQEIEALIGAGAEINGKGEFGNTPLHEAAGEGNAEAVRLLLEHGASRTTKNEWAQTAQDRARTAGHEHIVRLLSE